MNDDARISRELPKAVAGGLLLFVVGLLAAQRYLPEWRPARLEPAGSYVARFLALAQRGGIELEPGAPDVGLATADDDGTDQAGIAAKERGFERGPAARAGAALRVGVSRRTLPPPTWKGAVRTLEIEFLPSGQPVHVKLGSSSGMQFNNARLANESEIQQLATLLLLPGERAGEPRRETFNGLDFVMMPIAGKSEHLIALSAPGGLLEVQRRPGSTQVSTRHLEDYTAPALLLRSLRPISLFFLAAGLFLALLSRRRLDFANARLLALAGFLATAVAIVQAGLTPVAAWTNALGTALWAVWIFVVWAAAESFLRTFEPQFTATLDTLRAGRIGPRTGRALLFGLALGAGFAGCLMLVESAAVLLPGCWPRAASVALPAFSRSGTVIGETLAFAGCLTLLLALAARWLPSRWQALAAGLAGALLLEPVRLHPFSFELALGTAMLFGLVALARRWYGLATLLIAALAAALLPLAVYSLPRLGWLPGTFAVAIASVAVLVATGFSGLRRPLQVEVEGVRPPAFIRRIEEERRLKYEMDLLARIQRGLLPQHLPSLPGWDVAARSELATEAGGDLYDFLVDDAGTLWVAAGDVAGHGYSCAITHAMTTAALASLIVPGRTPSEVLRQVDRVLRRAGARRIFTSLALLRVDPHTGEGLLGNAGHPFPFLLLMAEGGVSEVEIPSLPLGQGPARVYTDEALRLPPGAILVFCSDGLFEAADRAGNQYGYDRPREILVGARQLPAQEIVEALMADWRHHIGAGLPPDDTTILVIKRTA